MLNNPNGTKVIKFGKFTGVLYPDVYFKFVTTLHNQHQDLIRAMTLAQVTLSDYSAIDFLNKILHTNVTRETPMELGYAQLLDALNMRKVSPISVKNTEQFAKERFSDLTLFPARDESKHGTTLFDDEKHNEKLGE